MSRLHAWCKTTASPRIGMQVLRAFNQRSRPKGRYSLRRRKGRAGPPRPTRWQGLKSGTRRSEARLRRSAYAICRARKLLHWASYWPAVWSGGRWQPCGFLASGACCVTFSQHLPTCCSGSARWPGNSGCNAYQPPGWCRVESPPCSGPSVAGLGCLCPPSSGRTSPKVSKRRSSFMSWRT